ncbi:LPS translocon maturation chaperone LptM [Terricaulis sp.]|uniref:LPS translocon maturation chaperone LptM n=1 Tax=Terricaulis sp. TaxID=2768686 RepID=UPI00378407DB
MNRQRTVMLLGLLALTALSACGIKGGLERPDPMWNREEGIRRECEQQARENRQQDPRCAQYQTGAQTQTTP